MTISRMHVIGVALLLGGCSGAPLDLSLDEQVAERRAVQTRSFAGRDRIEVIIAASGALRDLGGDGAAYHASSDNDYLSFFHEMQNLRFRLHLEALLGFAPRLECR